MKAELCQPLYKWNLRQQRKRIIDMLFNRMRDGGSSWLSEKLLLWGEKGFFLCVSSVPCFQKRTKLIFPFHICLIAGVSSHCHSLWVTSEVKACAHCKRGMNAAPCNHGYAVIFTLIHHPDKQNKPNKRASTKWKMWSLRGYSLRPDLV